MQTKNIDSSRPTPLATMILGLGTAVALALATPTLAMSKGEGALKPTGVPKDRTEVAGNADQANTEAGQPTGQATQIPTISAFLPPDPCSVGPDEFDCNRNGINDRCDIAAGMADLNGNSIPDSCEFGWGDLDLDGVVGARDMLLILNDWGTFGHDANNDKITNGYDLAIVLANWSTKG